MEEYKITNSRIETFLSGQRLFFFQGLIVVFGLLGVFKDYKEVLLALPIVVIIYVALFLYHFQRSQTNQCYKRRIEDKINDLCGEKLLFYHELGVEKIEKQNRFIFFNIASYTVLVFISIVAFVTYFTGTNTGVDKAFIILTAIVLVVLMIFFVRAVIDIKRTINDTMNTYIPDIEKGKSENTEG